MKNANELLPESNGANQFYKHPLSSILYTDGVKLACDQFQCFWFFDIVLSYQTRNFKNENEFQVWKLQRILDNEFIVICEDGNDNMLLSQPILFSDFEHDCLIFWLIDNTILLPAEY